MQATAKSNTRNRISAMDKGSSKSAPMRKPGLEAELASLRQRAMMKNATLMSTTSLQTATTAASEESCESIFVRKIPEQEEHKVRFDNTVKVRVFRSHREWSDEAKAEYWCPRMTNKELCQAIFDVNDAYDNEDDEDDIDVETIVETREADSLAVKASRPRTTTTPAQSSSEDDDSSNSSSNSSSSTSQAQPKLDLHEWILQSHHIACAISSKAEPKVIDSILKNPTAFAHFFDHKSVNGQTFRGLERYLSPTYCEKRKEGISEARSLVVQMSKAKYSQDDIAEGYAQLSRATCILSRLRGHADEQVLTPKDATSK